MTTLDPHFSGTCRSASGKEHVWTLYNAIVIGDPLLKVLYNGPDSDSDGLSDQFEISIGTNSFNADTDGDGVSDYKELKLGTDPLKPPSGAEIVSLGVVPDSSGVDQGSKMTFTINVQNTGANDMSSTRVQLKILKPGGRAASSPSKTITRFIAGSTRTVQITYNLPKSAATGDWTYGVYVYRSSTLLDSETDGGFKVRVPSGVIVSVADSPDPVVHGGTATFTVKIKNTGNLVWSNAKITIKILKPDGKLAKTLTITARNVQPGVEYTYTKDWRIPTRISTSAPIGTYTYNVYLTYGSTPSPTISATQSQSTRDRRT
jgi:hypothetical protein